MDDLNRTNDPRRRSFVEAANAPGCPFPIQNLPFGIFSTDGTRPRAGVAIGDLILDLASVEAAGLVAADGARTGGARVFDGADLNAFMALGPEAWRRTRAAIGDLLDAAGSRLRGEPLLAERALVAQSAATMQLPVFVRSYTDFYASRHHATTVGTMLRGADNALNENWLHLPVGYNGRASTVVVSGTDVHRPYGQLKGRDFAAPTFGPSRRLDFELEMGAIVGQGNAMGHAVTVEEASAMIFGYVLLNDWSARDIQAWEYQPLGPFQSKAFATTISPWVVMRDALEPFRVMAGPREVPLLPYLCETAPNLYDIDLEVRLTPEDGAAETIARSNARHLYYSAAQQLAHHTSSGCAMCIGDLLGSGTISGPERASAGSLLELSWGGKQPLALAGGAIRSFLEDGDLVEMTGLARAGGVTIGFGTAAGRILPPRPERAWPAGS